MMEMKCSEGACYSKTFYGRNGCRNMLEFLPVQFISTLV
jgi:hypothetical protein